MGAQNLASRGGAGAEAATNRGSARTPLPAANHRSVSPSRPPRPLFPLARSPPRVSGPTTSARADQAMCTRVQGPLGGVLASPSDGQLVALHTQALSAPSGSGGSGQSAPEEDFGLGWWARHGGARDLGSLGRGPALAPPFLPRPPNDAACAAGFPLINSFHIHLPAISWLTVGCFP